MSRAQKHLALVALFFAELVHALICLNEGLSLVGTIARVFGTSATVLLVLAVVELVGRWEREPERRAE